MAHLEERLRDALAGIPRGRRRRLCFRSRGPPQLLVNGYATVDPAIVRDVVENHLDDLIDFAAAVPSRMTVPPGL